VLDQFLICTADSKTYAWTNISAIINKQIKQTQKIKIKPEEKG